MKQSYSPGPWQIAPDFPYHVFSKDSRTLARVRRSLLPANPQTYVSEREAIANARLIAAAPDLLAALENVIEWARNVAPRGHEENVAHYTAMAQAAIARARGE